MKFDFTVEKNCGLGFSNLIRQVLIETSKSIKPIAFLISDGSNLYLPSDEIIDVVDFAGNLADLTISADSSIELPLSLEYKFKGKLTSKDLCNSSINVEEDIVLLNSLNSDKTLTISIVFDEGCGYKNSELSRKRLESLGVSIKGYQTISARYSDMIVATDVKEDLDRDSVFLEINSKSGSEKEKIKDALNKISMHFSELAEKL